MSAAPHRLKAQVLFRGSFGIPYVTRLRSGPIELHGQDGAAATIRTEMHRIRSVLGAVVEPNPYRFAAGVRVVSDADTVAGYLGAGRLG